MSNLDSASAAAARTPLLRLLGNAGLVFLGGALGTLARAALLALFGSSPEFLALPGTAATWVTLAINLGGAFFLALLIAAKADDRLRLFLGTGLLGGFTTYSALAFDVAVLTASGSYIGIVLTIFSLAGGLATALTGWRLGSGMRRKPPAAPFPEVGL